MIFKFVIIYLIVFSGGFMDAYLNYRFKPKTKWITYLIFLWIGYLSCIIINGQ